MLFGVPLSGGIGFVRSIQKKNYGNQKDLRWSSKKKKNPTRPPFVLFYKIVACVSEKKNIMF